MGGANGSCFVGADGKAAQGRALSPDVTSRDAAQVHGGSLQGTQGAERGGGGGGGGGVLRRLPQVRSRPRALALLLCMCLCACARDGWRSAAAAHEHALRRGERMRCGNMHMCLTWRKSSLSWCCDEHVQIPRKSPPLEITGDGADKIVAVRAERAEGGSVHRSDTRHSMQPHEAAPCRRAGASDGRSKEVVVLD